MSPPTLSAAMLRVIFTKPQQGRARHVVKRILELRGQFARQVGSHARYSAK